MLNLFQHPTGHAAVQRDNIANELPKQVRHDKILKSVKSNK
jgi:hypothetical protein